MDPYEVCEALPTKTVVYTDLVNFSKFSNGTDIMEVYKYINAMYKGKGLKNKEERSKNRVLIFLIQPSTRSYLSLLVSL